MKRIVYAGARLLTGSQIADAVLDYAGALAESEAAETVQIPVLTEKGARSTASLLLGPSSQIVAEDEESEFEELRDPEAVAMLQAKTRAHRPVATMPSPGSVISHDQAWTDEF